MESKLSQSNLQYFTILNELLASKFKALTMLQLNEIYENKTEIYVAINKYWNNIILHFRSGKISSEEASTEMENWLINAIKNEKNVDWNFVNDLLYYQLPILFKHFPDKMPGNIYWPALGYAYSMGAFDFDDREIIARLLKSSLPDRHMIMDDEEQKVYNKLPIEVTIYRGCSVAEIENGTFRFSWTIDKNIAYFFAKKRKREEKIETQVVELKVDKSKIIAYLDGRDEKEVIYMH
jgi:hypothetical protein